MNSFIVKMYLIPLSIIVTFLVMTLLLLQLGRATTTVVTHAFVATDTAMNHSSQGATSLVR